MKRIIIFGVIAAILCSMSMVCSAAVSDNWILNGSYDGTGSMPQFGNTKTQDCKVAEGEGRTGDAWKMLCGKSGSYNTYAWTLSYTCGKNLTLNNTYIFSFWAKASTAGTIELRSNNFNFDVIKEDGTSTNANKQTKLTLGTEYTLQTVKFKVNDVTIKDGTQSNSQLSFYLGSKNGYVMSTDDTPAYVWVDDVSLVEETADPTVAITAKNGDSEDVTESYVCGSADGTVQPLTSISAAVNDGHTGAVLIMAYYDANGILKNADSAVVGSDTASFSEITTKAGGKFKFYIFENGTIKPLSEKTEVTVVSQ